MAPHLWLNPSRLPSSRGCYSPTPCRHGALVVLGILLHGCSGGVTGDEELGDDGMAASEAMADNTMASSGQGGFTSQGSAGGGSAPLPNMGGTSGSGSMMSMDSEPDPSEGELGIFVGMTAAHNAVRAGLDLDPPLPDLEWSPEIAEFAQQWSDSLAQDCGSIAHRDQNLYGENIAIRGSTRLDRPFQPEEAVDGWAAEVACWDYGTINGTERCDLDCTTALFSNGCGHYTQVVWRNSERVGCGYSTCQEGSFTYEIWVCNYDPPGNYIGQTPY